MAFGGAFQQGRRLQAWRYGYAERAAYRALRLSREGYVGVIHLKTCDPCDPSESESARAGGRVRVGVRLGTAGWARARRKSGQVGGQEESVCSSARVSVRRCAVAGEGAVRIRRAHASCQAACARGDAQARST